VLGGVAGNAISSGHGAGTVLGALAGGLGGAAIEHEATRRAGVELTIRLDGGRTVVVTEPAGPIVYATYRAQNDPGLGRYERMIEDQPYRGRALAPDGTTSYFGEPARITNPLGVQTPALTRVRERYGKDALSIDETDGIGIEFDQWRFNLRLSNTEPLIRLNVESRGDAELMRRKTDEVLAVLEA